MPDAFQRYAAARDRVAALLDDLRTLLEADAGWYGGSGDLDVLERSAARLRDGPFVLAVVGEFSSGKSFLLNALLGKIALEERGGTTRITGLLATDINPSTATITELAYAEEERATAIFPDGHEERIPIDRLARFVAVGESGEGKIFDATDDDDDAPQLVRVGVDSAFLENGFVVADTPGLASINPAHRRATLGYLPGADAVLYLIDTQQPFTDGDASFLGIVGRYIESIFIIQTKIDLWRAADGGVQAWESAGARIVAQAAVHAPGTPVFPLSAREYAEGRLSGDPDLIAASRFPPFLAALDASLVATTGGARLRRAAADTRRIAARTAEALSAAADAFGAERHILELRRAALAGHLAAQDLLAAAGCQRLEGAGSALRAEIVSRGAAMRAALQRTLAQAFDTADIARLRDRAKLHIIVDETLAAAMGTFAGEVAGLVTTRLRDESQAAAAALGADPLPVAEDAAHAFGADPSRGTWSIDLETGLRGTIVLGALGGPALSLVTGIAARFDAAPFGTYMKRELTADFRTALYPAFERTVATFVDDIADRVERLGATLGARIAGQAERGRIEALGAIDRALAFANGDPGAEAAALRERAATATALAERVAVTSEMFADDDGIAVAARDGIAAAPAEAAPIVRFDPLTYEHGLRPERWRVAVIGAFKRGKSSLINALAETRVLDDGGAGAELRFPVHVRYGPEPRAYALSDDAAWDEIPARGLIEAAARTPVLIETPWSLPHQLVLVHTPPFDSGFAPAEEIVAAAAAGASELLVLFSRQLSERELDLYGRLNALGKPLSFVHTIADIESPAERRDVVALADRYLRERGIVPQRIFVVSTHVRGAWNELGALRATLTAHAEEHMERLRQAEVDRGRHARLATAGDPGRPRSLFDRILRRKH